MHNYQGQDALSNDGTICNRITLTAIGGQLNCKATLVYRQSFTHLKSDERTHGNGFSVQIVCTKQCYVSFPSRLAYRASLSYGTHLPPCNKSYNVRPFRDHTIDPVVYSNVYHPFLVNSMTLPVTCSNPFLNLALHLSLFNLFLFNPPLS